MSLSFERKQAILSPREGPSGADVAIYLACDLFWLLVIKRRLSVGRRAIYLVRLSFSFSVYAKVCPPIVTSEPLAPIPNLSSREETVGGIRRLQAFAEQGFN